MVRENQFPANKTADHTVSQKFLLEAVQLLRSAAIACRDLQEEFHAGNGVFDAVCFDRWRGTKTKIAPCQPDAVFDELQHPHEDLGYAPATCLRDTEKNIGDRKRHVMRAGAKKMEIYPLNDELREGTVKEEMLESLLRGAAVTTRVDTGHSKLEMKPVRRVYDAMSNSPVQVNDMPVERNQVNLVPRLLPVQCTIVRKFILEAVRLVRSAALACRDLQEEIHASNGVFDAVCFDR